jgi:hypothetical protein
MRHLQSLSVESSVKSVSHIGISIHSLIDIIYMVVHHAVHLYVVMALRTYHLVSPVTVSYDFMDPKGSSICSITGVEFAIKHSLLVYNIQARGTHIAPNLQSTANRNTVCTEGYIKRCSHTQCLKISNYFLVYYIPCFRRCLPILIKWEHL